MKAHALLESRSHEGGSADLADSATNILSLLATDIPDAILPVMQNGMSALPAIAAKVIYSCCLAYPNHTSWLMLAIRFSRNVH